LRSWDSWEKVQLLSQSRESDFACQVGATLLKLGAVCGDEIHTRLALSTQQDGNAARCGQTSPKRRDH